MIIQKIAVQNFRIHGMKTIDLSPETTVITGLNGSGKTSLVEAIYIALRGSSFKGSDHDIIKNGQEWYRIDILLSDDTKRTVKYNSIAETNKKKFEIDDKVHYRLPAGKKYPVVLFEPDDLQLFSGSPARRRRFIDTLISNIEPDYSSILSRYDRALKQRNILLKRGDRGDSLFVWNVALSEYGEKIISKRIEYIDKINELLPGVYEDISGQQDEVALNYPFSHRQNIKQYLLLSYEMSTEKDAIVGYTTVGPHRHDIEFYFNHNDADRVASRGEVRSFIITLKLVTNQLIKQILNINPLVILDDILSELDDNRQGLLINYFSNSQTVITSTNALVSVNDLIRIIEISKNNRH